MHKRIATWSIILVSLLGCYVIVTHFPRDTSSITLDNGIVVTIEINENLMAWLDPEISKTITIDYGDRQLEHKSDNDDYGYRIHLVKQKNDTIWVLEETNNPEWTECSFSDKDAIFEPMYTLIEKGGHLDTLLVINYENFTLTVD